MASSQPYNETTNKMMLFEDLLYFTYFRLLQLKVSLSLMASAYIIVVKQKGTFL